MTQRDAEFSDHRINGKWDRRSILANRLFFKGLLPAILVGVLAGLPSPVASAESRNDEPRANFPGAINNVGAPGEQVVLWQNWDDDQRQHFWFTPQGSQIIPYDWALALELPNSETLFFDNENMERLRYIPQDETPLNLDKLPIGFTKDLVWYSNESVRGDDLGSLKITYKDYGDSAYQAISREWLGMTCAACHTNQIEFDGTKMVIDGAPGMGDFEGLMAGLVESMEATLGDKDKFQRFATRVFGLGHTEAKSDADLKKHLGSMIDIRKAWNTRNSGDGVKYGFGRLDAFNSILNEIASAALGIGENRMPADAPVSYPFIWDAPHHDYIQWNGMVANDAKGALSRNVGEVLGVFGTLNLVPPSVPLNPEQLFRRRSDTSLQPPPGYESSVRVPNLGRLEHQLVGLWSPLWPDSVMPLLNTNLVDTGKELFDKHCAGCHETIGAESKTRLIKSVAVPATITGTDDTMARRFDERRAKTGSLQGQYLRYFPATKGQLDISAPKFYGDVTQATGLLVHAVSGTLAHDRVATGTVIRNTIKSGLRTVLERDKPRAPSYKARSLNGIWATAPYLHNGSIPTLMQLLKPSRRKEAFYVGSREFDPVEVGFKYERKDYGSEDPNFLFNTLRKGNRNTGHVFYGDHFEKHDEDFKALMAYLRTL